MAKTDWHIDSDPVKPEDMNQIGQEINENRQDIEKHSFDKNNPHSVTKSQVGLSNVDNIKQASKEEFDSHKNNKNNPHNVTKGQVGLSNVDNVKQETPSGAQAKADKAKQDAINWAKSFGFGAELVEANADSVSESGLYALTGNTPDGNTSYGVHLQRTNTHAAQIVVRPTNKIYFRSKNNGKWNEWLVISTTNDLEKLAALVSKHTSDKSNPHWVTKAQVGLSNVDNVQQATKSEFKTHLADTVRHITANERNTWNAKETVSGSQAKADKALSEAKKYMNIHAQMHKVTHDDGQALMIPEGSDLNKITKTGFYTGRNLINQPSKNFTWFYYTVLQQGTFECVQYATAFSKRAETYIRRSDVSGEFSAWQLSSASDLEWTTVPTLLNGWKTFTRPVQYIQIGNMVHFRGAVTDGLYFEPIFYMPTNLRPKQVYAIPCASIGTGSSGYPANRLQIETTGAVMIRFDGSVPSYSLDGACYAIN